MSTIEEQKKLVKARCDGWKLIPDVPLAKKQLAYPLDAPVQGPYWVSRTTLPQPPEDDIRGKIYEAFDLLKTHPDQRIVPPAEVPLRDVHFEWMGSRSGVDNRASEPSISERDKYQALVKETKGTTILHIHGGAFYVGTAATWRFTSMRLARSTGYRIAAPTYRLAPQNPFPGALLDVFMAYMALLSPPPGSFHSPTPASRIVLAADSAGANLCLALLQVLLTLRRAAGPSQQATVTFHGRRVPLELPAGLTLNCSYVDLTDALPSWFHNGEYDILEIQQPPLLPTYPSDSVWPSTPPRGSVYTHESSLDHPLVSVCAAADWSGAPPMWFAAGAEERGLDGQRIIASTAHSQGVMVLWDEYEGMCHCWAMILYKLPQSKHCFDAWAEACRHMGENPDQNATQIASRRRILHMPDCSATVKDFDGLAPLSFDEVRRRMRRKAEEHPPWTGRTDPKKLKAAL